MVHVTVRLGRDALVDAGTASVIIGRVTESAISLADANVSRPHSRLELRRGALRSTGLCGGNGSRVNGTVMDEAMLTTGDRLTAGECLLVVELLPACGVTRRLPSRPKPPAGWRLLAAIS